jgi:hypothetical protein
MGQFDPELRFGLWRRLRPFGSYKGMESAVLIVAEDPRQSSPQIANVLCNHDAVLPENTADLRGADEIPRRYLVIVPGTADDHGAAVQLQRQRTRAGPLQDVAFWHVSTRPLRAYCKECNGTTKQIETCGHMAIAPRGFLHSWVQQALPGALAQAFASHMGPGPERWRGPDPHDEPAGDLDLFSLPGRPGDGRAGAPGPGDLPLAGLRLLAREAMAAVKPERGRKSNGQ